MQYTGLVFVCINVFVRTSIRHQEDRDITESERKEGTKTRVPPTKGRIYLCIYMLHAFAIDAEKWMQGIRPIRIYIKNSRDKCSLSLSFDLDAL